MHPSDPDAYRHPNHTARAYADRCAHAYAAARANAHPDSNPEANLHAHDGAERYADEYAGAYALAYAHALPGGHALLGLRDDGEQEVRGPDTHTSPDFYTDTPSSDEGAAPNGDEG